jgi:hypothetical protein
VNLVKDLQLQLNNLWAGIIKKIDFDILNGRITLSVEVIEDGNVNDFEVNFIDVSSHYYLKNNGSNRFSFYEVEDGDYLELTSVDYYSSGIGDIIINSLTNEWVCEYFSKANFVIEIWSSILFIEAKAIKINSVTYENLI